MLTVKLVSLTRATLAACAAFVAFAGATPAAAEAAHAIAMHGAPAMSGDFAVVPYADADAPKRGRLVQGVLGTFDSLNPFIVKGLPAHSLRGYVIESLMARPSPSPDAGCCRNHAS